MRAKVYIFSKWLHVDLYMISVIAIVGLAFLVTFIVYMSAWVSEDSFITLRYVNNTLNGYGAVFNIGEYVYGYTHPLWYMMLVIGTYLFQNEVFTAITLELIFTFFQLLFFGHLLLKRANNPIVALIIYTLACSAFISSDIWVSFQTGGLENALSHFLILLVVSETYFHNGKRPGILLLLISLLCLSRPDYALFSLPLSLLLLPHLRTIRAAGITFIAAIPSFTWLCFSLWYYGSVIPNTGTAKIGIYPNWLYGIRQGIIYAGDWCISDPITVGMTVAFFIYAYSSRKNKITLAILSAILLHLAWVTFIGGDFMRGRFFMPVLTATVIIGSFEMLQAYGKKSSRMSHAYSLLTLLIFLIAAFQSVGNALDWNTNHRCGILNERKYYPGYSLRSYLRDGQFTNPYLDLAFANELRTYADVCGQSTVHFRNPGTIGYLTGPKVTIIDTLGLTDRYIANLPKSYQIDLIPRPGHADKYIPVAYLSRRNDISLLPNWTDRIRERDCSVGSSLAPFRKSMQYWTPNGIVNYKLPIQQSLR